MKYSLWLVPNNPAYNELKNVIDDLALQSGSPNFEPHLTLIGNLETDLATLITATKEITKGLKPFKISLSEVACSTTYFQAVFVRARTDPTLMQLNLKFKEALNLTPDVFMPHLSLWYDTDFNMDKRYAVANSTKLVVTEFLVDRIIITPSVADPAQWQHLAELKFGF